MASSTGVNRMSSGWGNLLGITPRAAGNALQVEKFNYQQKKDAETRAHQNEEFKYRQSHDADTTARENANQAETFKQHQIENKAREDAAQRQVEQQAAEQKQREVTNANAREAAQREALRIDMEEWGKAHPAIVAPATPKPSEPTDPLAPYRAPDAQAKEMEFLQQQVATRAGIPSAGVDPSGKPLPPDVPPSVLQPIVNRAYDYIRAGLDPNMAAQKSMDDILGAHPVYQAAKTHWFSPNEPSQVNPDPALGKAPPPPAPVDVSQGPQAKYQQELANWQKVEQQRIDQTLHPPVYTPDWRERDKAAGYVPPPPPPGLQQQTATPPAPVPPAPVPPAPTPPAPTPPAPVPPQPQQPQQPQQQTTAPTPPEQKPNIVLVPPADTSSTAPATPQQQQDPNQKTPRFIIKTYQ
jgi:hypothetical protein